MKGYISFCPHFHQPHFQLHKTRESVYDISYEPWLNLLEMAVTNYDNFYINIHLSGPFLYWIKEEKKEFIDRLKNLISSNKIGFIGGFCDEAFIQLSARPDDVFFQLKEYGDLLFDTLGISFDKWQGIHIPERECGEFLLNEITKAAKVLGAKPLYYLDSETFYEGHYADVGGPNDYCKKYLGFCDPVSKTTVSKFPKEMLNFCFRDSIGGNDFYSFPMHSEYRYHFLKNNAFNEFDNVKISAEEYFRMIKKELIKAYEVSEKCNKDIPPVVVIFEDAEKFGDWSKNPLNDTEWMNNFFRLVEEDEEVSFIGLKDYYSSNSYFDTYPVFSSRSYPEWENWTGKRGIRGVVYGDEHLRKTLARLNLFEKNQECFDKLIIDKLECSKSNEMIKNIILDSNMRFYLIEDYLLKTYGEEICSKYRLINRVRHVLYQEDSKWASRHPNYGSAPYLDNMGLPQLEICNRVLDELFEIVSSKKRNNEIEVIDWDSDGEEEVILYNKLQTAIIDMRGGCIDYHVVLREIDGSKINALQPYNVVYKTGMPLVFTETDSSLKVDLGSPSDRIERCRNSYRCDIYCFRDGDYQKVGDFSNALFKIKEVKSNKDKSYVVCEAKQVVNDVTYTMTKKFVFKDELLDVYIVIDYNKEVEFNLFVAPQIVASLTASDEVNFKPISNICFDGCCNDLNLFIDKTVRVEGDNKTYSKYEDKILWNGKVSYEFEVNSGNGENFMNSLDVSFEKPELIEYMDVFPAVMNYYFNYVGDLQSNLSYNSSGIMMLPLIKITDECKEVKIEIKWNFDIKEDENKLRIPLVESFS